MPSGLAAIAVSQRPDDSVRLATPENMRKAPSRARDGSSGRAPAVPASETVSEYSTPDRAVLLGKAGAITRVDQEQAVREPERGTAEGLHDGVADPLAETALDHRPGDQERGDDEHDGAVGESGPRCRGRDDASEDGDGNRKQGCGQDRQGPGHDREDRRGKQREEVPRRGGEAVGDRREPEPQCERKAGDRCATHGERVACTTDAAGATGLLIAAIPCDTCR